MLQKTMVQQKLFKNIKSCAKFWNTKKLMLRELLKNETFLWKNLSHCNIVLMERGKNEIKCRDYPSTTERFDIRKSINNSSRQFNLLTLR